MLAARTYTGAGKGGSKLRQAKGNSPLNEGSSEQCKYDALRTAISQVLSEVAQRSNPRVGNTIGTVSKSSSERGKSPKDKPEPQTKG